MFLKRYGEQLRSAMPDDEDINIAIGKGHEHLPSGTLCVGNCTAKHRPGARVSAHAINATNGSTNMREPSRS